LSEEQRDGEEKRQSGEQLTQLHWLFLQRGSQVYGAVSSSARLRVENVFVQPYLGSENAVRASDVGVSLTAGVPRAAAERPAAGTCVRRKPLTDCRNVRGANMCFTRKDSYF
jgi:hypothetical protein